MVLSNEPNPPGTGAGLLPCPTRRRRAAATAVLLMLFAGAVPASGQSYYVPDGLDAIFGGELSDDDLRMRGGEGGRPGREGTRETPPEASETLDAVLREELADDAIRALPSAIAAYVLSICAVRDDAACIRRFVAEGWQPDLLNHAGTTPLATAVAAGSASAVAALIQSGADPAAETPMGSAEELALMLGDPAMIRLVVHDAAERATALLLAASRTVDIELAIEALDLGADPDAADAEGMPPLHLALLAGSHELAGELLARGADPKLRSATGILPLSIAILQGDAELVDRLLAAGASPNSIDSEVRALSLASVVGDLRIVRALLDAGADPELTNKDGTRPALTARAAGQNEIARMLGGTPEVEPPPDLLAAVESKEIERVATALASGANANTRDAGGTPVLLRAAAAGQVETVAKLLDHGADVLSTGEGGASALHAALAAPSSVERTMIANLVVAAAADVGRAGELLRATDLEGRSGMVMFAALYGTHGADSSRQMNVVSLVEDTRIGERLRDLANVPDADGITPFLAATLSGNEQVIALLVEAGARPAPLPDGQTLHDLARARQAWNILFYLPDDRPIPEGLTKGASREAKMEMQRRLSEWGYYSGDVDGIFGAGSRAGMIAFLKDRREELLGMADAGFELSERGYPGISYNYYGERQSNDVTLSLEHSRGGCRWKIYHWEVERPETYDLMVGCFWPSTAGAWNGNGFAFVRSRNGEDLRLFGPGGWDGHVPFQ